ESGGFHGLCAEGRPGQCRPRWTHAGLHHEDRAGSGPGRHFRVCEDAAGVAGGEGYPTAEPDIESELSRISFTGVKGERKMGTTTKVLLGFFLACAAVWGQAASTAQVNGTVRDATALAVPGAEVKVTQTATGLVRTVTSGADGNYVITNLPVGPYILEVSKDGFTKYVQAGILLQVGSNPTVDASLKVGSLSEQVVVQADAALVETRSTGIGTVVDNQRVLEMPLNGRNATELIFLAGMANVGNNVGPINSVRNYPTVVVSVAGGIGNGVTYLLDGANHNDAANNLNLPLPFPDALQEFKVETSALPA